MSLVSGEVKFPPRSYKNDKELFLPENEHLKDTNIESFLAIDEKVHANVEGSKIVEFFNGKSVFLTGSTGFIGKLITEKLLRTCADIKTLYVLVRTKKGMDADKRLDQTFENEIFCELRKAQPKFRQKVVPINGDMSLPNLGISIDDMHTLIENVNVIIHGAATVRFDEKLRLAAAINVSGTRGIMSLAQQCKHLVSLVHISTAYSNCVHKEIREEIYAPPMKPEHFLKMVETHTDKDLEKKLVTILSGWPNTYTFTKAIAEHTVKTMAKDIPTAVCRPSIVTSTYREPLKGWIDNFNGPMGAAVSGAMGFMRTVHLDPKKVADIVPGDFVANTVIVAAYQNQFNKKGEIKIYNTISSADNPLIWEDFINLTVHYGKQAPPIKALWYYCSTMNKNRNIHLLYTVALHFLPALLYDTYNAALGKKGGMLSLYKKVNKFIGLLSFFTLREWEMHNENSLELWKSLSEKDKDLFNFSTAVSNFNWNYYIGLLSIGMRLYLLKDGMETIPEAKKRYKRLYYVHCAFRSICFFIGMYMSMKIFNIMINVLINKT